MTDYGLAWVNDQLAVGHAPSCQLHLDEIRAAGIKAIINLCGEYCNLHEIEAEGGFEVYYLPTIDEEAPDPAKVDRALTWLTEMIGRGKRVLVHCRFGKGRTGTFVVAYLMTTGLALDEAVALMKHKHTLPTSRPQWKYLKKLDKKLTKARRSA